MWHVLGAPGDMPHAHLPGLRLNSRRQAEQLAIGGMGHHQSHSVCHCATHARAHEVVSSLPCEESPIAFKDLDLSPLLYDPHGSGKPPDTPELRQPG